MSMKKHSLLKGTALFLSVFFACTPSFEEDMPETGLEEIIQMTIILPSSDISPESRMNIAVGNGVDYYWTDTDSIGIFPNDGYQVAFPLKTAEESNSATFTGGGWALKASSSYAAYYPFNYGNMRSDSIPVSYLGQRQKGNNNTLLSEKYNYMSAIGNKPESGTVNFNMLRLGRFIILKFKVPEPTTLTSVKLIASENVFTTKGYFDLWANTHSITSTEKSFSLTIDLEDVKTTTENEEVTIYFFMAPVDLSGKTLTIEATDINGKKILSTVAGKDMTASKAYALTGNSITEVEVEEAGTLQEKLGDNYLNVVSLKIKGKLNGTDIALIRRMLNHSNYGKLISLDMEEAEIVAGGNSYYSNYTTTDNVIGNYMFLSCNNLHSIVLPKNITSITQYAFADCHALSSIIIPNTVSEIGKRAFDNTALVEITIPDNVKSIGDYAFNSCNYLRSVKLGNGINSINSGTFSDCSSLEEIELPYNITTIGENAFYACSGLSNIKIHGAVTSIGSLAFSSCFSLKSIDLPSSVVTIGNQAFQRCKSLEEIILPINLTTIRSQAFYECTSLASVTLSPNISFSETEHTYIFANCGNINNVTISPGIKVIPQDMFRGCASLKEVTIPSSVTTIGKLAFYQSGLEKVYIHCTTPPTMITSFYEIPSSCILYVPKGYIDAYKASSKWGSSVWVSSFANIKEMQE